MPAFMKSAEARWTEGLGYRILAWFYLPGHVVFYVFIATGIYMLYQVLGPELEDLKNNLSRMVQLVLSGIIPIYVGIWFLIGAYQVLLHDIRKLFIVYHLFHDAGKVRVKGYYLKQDSFTPHEIASVKRFRIEGHWLKRINTLFARETDHFRLDLKDGRQFCFNGKDKDIESVLVRLSGKEITEQLPENWDITSMH